ncbi:MAG: hypothetical protein ACYSWW_17305 [Planctomycetota bacterium]
MAVKGGGPGLDVVSLSNIRVDECAQLGAAPCRHKADSRQLVVHDLIQAGQPSGDLVVDNAGHTRCR